MPKPATFTQAEISALADRLREVWRPGSQITPWIRDNADRLTKLIREERFSWAAVAAALTEVGIVFRTGNPWTATNLAKAVSEFRYSGRGNPTAEHKAEIAAAMEKWRAEEDALHMPVSLRQTLHKSGYISGEHVKGHSEFPPRGYRPVANSHDPLEGRAEGEGAFRLIAK